MNMRVRRVECLHDAQPVFHFSNGQVSGFTTKLLYVLLRTLSDFALARVVEHVRSRLGLPTPRLPARCATRVKGFAVPRSTRDFCRISKVQPVADVLCPSASVKDQRRFTRPSGGAQTRQEKSTMPSPIRRNLAQNGRTSRRCARDRPAHP